MAPTVGAYDPAVSSILVVELWYDHEPAIDRIDLVEAVRSRQPDATTTSTDPTHPLLIAFPAIVHHFPDGPAAMLVSIGKPQARNHDSPPHDFTQTWSWPEAKPTFATSTHALAVTDMLGRVHATRTRVAAFHSVVDAILELTQPIGTWWPISGVALPPSAATAPLLGLVNVRLFNDANRPGHLLMTPSACTPSGYPTYRSTSASCQRAASLPCCSRWPKTSSMAQRSRTATPYKDWPPINAGT